MSHIPRKQNHFAKELTTLCKDLNLQQMGLVLAKLDLEKVKKENTTMQRELEDLRKGEERQEEEI